MRDGPIVRGFENHDQAINSLRAYVRALEKIIDKNHHISLTNVMVLDTLLGILYAKGTMTREEFDGALKKLSDETQAAMDKEAKDKEAAGKMEGGTVKVLSQDPAIPVVK